MSDVVPGDITLSVVGATTQLDENSMIIYSLGDGQWYDVTTIPASVVPTPFIRISVAYHTLLLKQNEDPTYMIYYDKSLGYPVCKPKYIAMSLNDFKNYKKSDLAYRYMMAKQDPFTFQNTQYVLVPNDASLLTAFVIQAWMAQQSGDTDGFEYIATDKFGNGYTFNLEETLAFSTAYNKFINAVNAKNKAITVYINAATNNLSIKDLNWDTYNAKDYPAPTVQDMSGSSTGVSDGSGS